MKTPAVSVVIPAWNAAAFLERTLESVRAQTFTDYEVVVVDDGSADDTHGVASRWLAAHGVRGRAIRQANKMIAGARNTGMRAAEAPIVALLDHDDLWYPEKLAAAMDELARHPEADLVCHNENITKDGAFVRLSRNGPAAEDMYLRLLLEGNALSPSASVFKLSKALEIGGFREDPDFNTVEDYDFWMRLSRVAVFRFLDRVLGEYQLVERAASRRVEYHHGNLEKLLLDHFATAFPAPTLSQRLQMRRRLAVVHRSALAQLAMHREEPALQRRHAARMLALCPWDPKNVARGLLWALKGAGGA